MTRNQGRIYRARVAAADAGRSLLDFHLRHFRHTGPAEWRRRMEAGAVRRNGRPAGCDDVLHDGDLLEFHRDAWEEPEVPRGFAVAHEDADLLAVVKPAGVQVLPGGPFHESTLLAFVRASAPDRADSAPAHRLGRGTSGLILFGKSARARAHLAREFRAQRVRKTYLAWVEGIALPATVHARQPIGSVAHGSTTAAAVTLDGRPSFTRLRVLARDARGGRTLLAAQPISGRPNQIRVHAAACGAPLCGDPLYGAGGVPRSDATPGAGGYLLHAAALAVRHPGGGWLRLRSRPDWLERGSSGQVPDS